MGKTKQNKTKNFEPYLVSYPKNNLKWITDQSAKPKTIKLPKENKHKITSL